MRNTLSTTLPALDWPFARSSFICWSEQHPSYADRMMFMSRSARYWARVDR